MHSWSNIEESSTNIWLNCNTFKVKPGKVKFELFNTLSTFQHEYFPFLLYPPLSININSSRAYPVWAEKKREFYANFIEHW